MTDTPEPETAFPRTGRRKLTVAAAGSVLWLAGLAVLTQLERPVVVNHRQVRRADLVVSALVENISEKRIRIEALLAGEQPSSRTLIVSNLDDVQVTAGEAFIVPLWRDGRIVKVSNPAKPKLGGPVVYPDTPQTRSQLETAIQLGPIRE